MPIDCLTLNGDEIIIDEECNSIEPQSSQGDYIDGRILEEMPNIIMRMLTKGEISGGKYYTEC